MKEKYFLGIDVGTSLIKAVIFDSSGREISSGNICVQIDSPYPGWSQLDMNSVWDATNNAISSVLTSSKIDPRLISVIGVTGQGDGAWMIDKNGNPVYPAPLWNDGRASEIVDRWQNSGLLSKYFEKSGTVLWSGAQAPLLIWLRENNPKAYDQISFVFCAKDWIRFKLTGEISTDETDGSIPFMAIESRNYDKGQIAMLGLEDIVGKLPPIFPSHHIAGMVTVDAAEKTGLTKGTPVVTGMLDVAANAIGLGAIGSEQTMTILGTTALNGVVMDKPIFVPRDIGAIVCHAVPGMWIRALGTMSGTPNLEWYLDSMGRNYENEALLSGKDVYSLLEAAISDAPLGSGGVIYHPYLSGERVPFLNPAARAGFYGISMQTDQACLARSVYEGVALAIRDCFEKSGVHNKEVVLSGGGANSHTWCQILADVTGSKMTISSGNQFGALGVAIAGAIGIGFFDSYKQAADAWIKKNRIHECIPENKMKYDQLYHLYCQLVEKMEPFWKERSCLLESWKIKD